MLRSTNDESSRYRRQGKILENHPVVAQQQGKWKSNHPRGASDRANGNQIILLYSVA
jgi:hypothetical protein